MPSAMPVPSVGQDLKQSDANTPTTNQAENEMRWASAGENLAVLNFSEKVCILNSNACTDLFGSQGG
jgi:hypothetical protein